MDGYEGDNLPRGHEKSEVDWQALGDQNIAEIAIRDYVELRSEMEISYRRLAEAMHRPLRLESER